MPRRAFTLTEVLVVIAVMTLLSAILFPVFARAKAAGRKTVCASRFRQVGGATLQYAGDYDDRWVTPVQKPGAGVREDRIWVQLVMPYSRSFRLFRCPEDPHGPDVDVSFSSGLVSAEVDARFYAASERVETGFNFQNLSPVVREGGRWTPVPRILAEAGAGTLLFVESAWNVDKNGRPSGGGSALVEPPCRYGQGDYGTPRDSFEAGRAEVFTLSKGWDRDLIDGMPYGGAYGWHDSRATATMADGHIRALRIPDLARGCDAKSEWSGFITDSRTYLWDRE